MASSSSETEISNPRLVCGPLANSSPPAAACATPLVAIGFEAGATFGAAVATVDVDVVVDVDGDGDGDAATTGAATGLAATGCATAAFTGTGKCTRIRAVFPLRVTSTFSRP